MALKKRDFQKIAQQIQEFLSKLVCEEDTADLRDALNLALLYMQRYYKTLRSRSHSNTISPSTEHRSFSGTVLITNSFGTISPVSPACGVPNQFEWKWFNLESPRLSASLGTSEFSSLSPFLHAAKAGELEVLEELISKDPDIISSVDGLGRNGIMYTVHGNTDKHTECLDLLLKQTTCSLDHQANDDSTALHVAAHENNSAALGLLLQNKASCNIADNESRTALHWAAANSSVENLKLLLQHGANIAINDCEGLTPAMWACHFEQLQNLLVLKSALVRTDPREEALSEETDLKGKTVIHWAVNKTGSIQCLKELLTEKSGLLCDRGKKNILHTAAEQGILPACQLVLGVCGSDCLSITDSKGRTPLHLAALCGHAEIVNFLLEEGADLSARDNNGHTPVDLIKRKQLYYCMMVLGINPQYQHLYPTDDPATSSPRNDAIEETENQREIAPSAPPAREVCENDVLKGSLGQKFETKGEVRRKSEPAHRPTPLPRQTRKKSAPASVHNQRMKNNETRPDKDISIENQKSFSSNSSSDKEHQGTVRRHSLLTRQGGIQEDGGTLFDLRTPDGEEIVFLVDMDDLQANVGDLDEDELEIECGFNHEEEGNFEYSTRQLAEGRGSASSVHSEPDHADNCSVSVELSVSSLGSDNEEVLRHDVTDSTNDYLHTSEHQRNKTDTPIMRNEQQEAVHLSPHPPQGHPHPQPTYSSNEHDSLQQHGNSEPLENEKEKKKKKTKTKTKLSDPEPTHTISPPRGVIAPLNPPDTLPRGTSMGGKETMTPRPGPWEHPSLGILRGGSPESPRFGAHAPYRTPGELEVDEINSREGNWFDRPRTPEPPQSPRDVANKPVYCPMASRVQGDDKSMGYSSGSNAQTRGQALLRNTDMMRGHQPEQMDSKTNTGSMSKSKSPQKPSFSLHGPVPHPPKK